MSEATSGAGADTTPAAPAASASDTPAGDQGGHEQQPGTAQAAASEPAAGASGADGQTVAEGAPEAYEDFKVPDGVQLDTTTAEEFKGLAKDLGLSQAKAQQMVDILAKQTQAAAAAQAAEIQRVQTLWAEEVKADKEIGGEKLAENLAKAQAAMEATTTPQMRMLLDRTGLGSHAEFIRHFLKIAPAFAEDKHVPGGSRPAGAGKSAAQILYPNQT